MTSNPLHRLSDRHQEVARNTADEAVRTRHMVMSGDVKGYALVVDGWAAPIVAALGLAIEHIESECPTTGWGTLDKHRDNDRLELLSHLRNVLRSAEAPP